MLVPETTKEEPVMSKQTRLHAVLTAIAVLALALGLAACGGGDDDNGTESGAGGKLIQSNPANGKVTITVGSKNFTEEFILGEIYAQALQHAGYNIKKDLNLGDSTIAIKALKQGEISGYPDYISTLLTEFYGLQPNQIPPNSQQGAAKTQSELQKDGLTSFAPTPFADANALGTLKSTADKLGVTTISELQGKSQDLTLYGSPECRQRIDCLVGLEDIYGLKFKSFTPVDIGLRYTVLDKGQADLSILFTSDAQLAAQPDKYVLLKDDKGIFPAGNVVFITDPATVKKAGPDYQKTIEQVQRGLSLPVIQELNARVDIDKQTPADVAAEYLKESGYIK
jgi:glycine betaine/choline ABC-type transport system substrate-binding protein